MQAVFCNIQNEKQVAHIGCTGKAKETNPCLLSETWSVVVDLIQDFSIPIWMRYTSREHTFLFIVFVHSGMKEQGGDGEEPESRGRMKIAIININFQYCASS